MEVLWADDTDCTQEYGIIFVYTGGNTRDTEEILSTRD